MLENRNSNITMQLFCIIKALSDFRLVVRIREEIDKIESMILHQRHIAPSGQQNVTLPPCGLGADDH